jgi:uncharacterized protein (DUF2267 family)
MQDRHLERFHGMIRTEMHGYPEADPARLAAAVFDLLAARISTGEIQKVVRSLPRDIRELWGIPS